MRPSSLAGLSGSPAAMAIAAPEREEARVGRRADIRPSGIMAIEVGIRGRAVVGAADGAAEAPPCTRKRRNKRFI